MFLFIHRPFEIWPVLAEIRVERVYMIGAILAIACYPGRRWISNPQTGAYAAFAVAMLVSWVLSPWSSESSSELVVENYLKVLVFYALMIQAVHDERSLRHLTLGYLIVMFLFMLHSYWEYRNGRHVYRMGFARMVGVGNAMSDPNTFSASIVYSLPFVATFWTCRPSRRLRLFLVGYVGLAVLCILLTGSRGALMGLLFVTLLTLARARGKHRWRIAVAVVVAAPLVWTVLPESLQNRFWTIIDPSVGPSNAQTSAEARTEGFWTGVSLFSQFPLTGCGPGAWRPASGSFLEAHNLYGQLMGEMGMLGISAFASILLAFWWNRRRIYRAYRAHPEWNRDRDFVYQLTGAISLSVVAMLFVGWAGHNLFRFNWVWNGGFLIIAHYCVRRRLARRRAASPYPPQPQPQPLQVGRYPLGGWGLTR